MVKESNLDRGPVRPAWIALTVAGTSPMLAEHARLASDPSTFVALLEQVRPRVAVVSEPPASRALLEHVALERRRRPSMRIVHLAAEDDVDARLEALRLGFDESLPWTIDLDELVGRIGLLDARAHTRAGTSIAIGDDLELDLVAHELRRHGEPVHLRPKEFALLAMLAGHPGRAYTRRQLLDRVWGHDHDGDPRTVDVHIRWLRSKIEDDPARPERLLTLRGVGYRLDTAER